MKRIIKIDKSIIPSCDFQDIDILKNLVKETDSVDGIGGYKIGFELCLKYGIERVVNTIKEFTNLPIIYDHQKAGTDIPEFGIRFANAVKCVDAVILFPFTGPDTEKEWIKSCRIKKLGIILGGEMTHRSFLKSDNGFLDDDAPLRIYEIAAKLNVNNFVVPGNKIERFRFYKEFLDGKCKNPVFYSPGLIAQNGKISECAKFSERWHGIIGRALYDAKDIKQKAKGFVKELRG